MAVNLIPNQLVKLYDSETFNQRNKRLTLDYRQYCQIVREEQTTMFQLQVTPDSENLLVNPDFTDDISSWQQVTPTWQWASGRLQGIKSSAASPLIYQQVNTTIGRTYKIRFTAQLINSGSQLTVIANQGALQTWIYTTDDYGLGEFTDEVYFTSDLATAQIQFLFIGASGDLIYLDDISVERLSFPVVQLETCTGSLVKTIPIFAQGDDYISYSVEWYGLDEGCYRICITGVDDTEFNYLDDALALATEGLENIELEQGGNLKWYG